MKRSEIIGLLTLKCKLSACLDSEIRLIHCYKPKLDINNVGIVGIVLFCLKLLYGSGVCRSIDCIIFLF